MIAVRPYEARDAADFRRLYLACQAHYGLSSKDLTLLDDVIEELSDPRGTHADLAWHGDKAVGFTCWMRVVPAGNSFAFYMKELFVTKEARGLGAGRALMQALAQRAIEMGADSVRWESKEPDALIFYERLGQSSNGKTSFTASGAALNRLAQQG